MNWLVIDIVECMANSDNVIRAGLTPKMRDIPNLVLTLTYIPALAGEHLVQPSRFRASNFTTLYDPPIAEFSVLQVVLPAGQSDLHPPVGGPSIAIVTEGKGSITFEDDVAGQLDVAQGSVVFISAGVAVEFHEKSKEQQMVVYRAYVEA
jgi:mannose-6-phosphate isomerase